MKNISISTKSLLTSYEPENKNVNVIIYSRFLTAINITFSDPVSCRDVIKAIVNKMRNVPYMQRDIEYDLKELGTNTFFNRNAAFFNHEYVKVCADKNLTCNLVLIACNERRTSVIPSNENIFRKNTVMEISEYINSKNFKIDYYKLMNVCNTLLTFIKHEKGNHIPNKTCLNALRVLKVILNTLGDVFTYQIYKNMKHLQDMIKETGVGNKTLIVILFEHTKNLIHHCVIRYKMILSCPKLDSRPTQFLFTNLHFVIDSISRMPSKYSMGTPKLHVDVVYGSINIEHEVLDIPINDYAYSRNFLPINKQCVMRKSLIRNLPLETSIQLTICFCDVNSNWKMFSGSTPLFNTKSELKQGIEIIGMFEYEEGYDMGFTGNNYFNDSSLTITIEFESHPFDVVYSCEKMISTFNEFSSRYVDQNLIVSPKYNLGIPMEILNFSKYMKNPNSEVCEKLNYLIKTQKMSINLALEIINEKYVSYFLRNTAFNTLVSHFKEFSDYIHIFVKEIIVNMADIPYSLKWVTNKANDDVFFAVNLFWYLYNGVHSDNHYKTRYIHVLNYVLMNLNYITVKCILKQIKFIKLLKDWQIISVAGEKINFDDYKDNFDFNIMLPHLPNLEVDGIDTNNFKILPSKTKPFLINFYNIDKFADNEGILYKEGDNLKYDRVVMTITKEINKMWRNEGFDIDLITYNILPVDYFSGIIEIVKNASSLRQIEGVTGGVFNEKCINTFLQNYNPSENEMLNAYERFFKSLAGYCVIMYIVGAGDRHNDNIMIKTDGQLFHIDFGKVFGDKQKFVNINRDRVDFVLSSDMVYILKQRQSIASPIIEFKNYTLSLYNAIRNKKDYFMQYFKTTISSYLPNDEDVLDFIYSRFHINKDINSNKLFLQNIDEALSAASTQLNFFIHSIASFQPTKGEGDTKSLSYISGKHSLLRDGMVTSICCTHYTSLELNKVFIINIRRVNNVNTTIKRTYQQIMEFYDKITLKYENISFPKLKSHKKAKRKYLEGIIPTINCMFAMFTNDYILRKDDMVYEFVSSKQM